MKIVYDNQRKEIIKTLQRDCPEYSENGKKIVHP